MSEHDDRGAHARFQMFSKEGNDAVADMLITVLACAEGGLLPPTAIKDTLREGVANVAIKFPEVHDTEPECEIVDEMNAWLVPNGYAAIDRGDL
jgi:hypothetical protein